MKTIRNWRDLEEYGIILLTGESCGYMMRLLFDLTKEGVKTIESFLGSNIQCVEGSNWNTGHVASIMLPSSYLNELAAFCLLRHHAVVYICKNAVYGLSKSEDEQYYEDFSDPILRKYATNGVDRNTHQMSGRVA